MKVTSNGFIALVSEPPSIDRLLVVGDGIPAHVVWRGFGECRPRVVALPIEVENPQFGFAAE